MSDFLAAVERRAYKQALYALRDNDAALDAVQDAMLKLADKYADKPVDELPMLFQRILQNVIRDFFRRQKVRSLFSTLFSTFQGGEDSESDPLETLEAATDSNLPESPQAQVEQAQIMAAIEKEIARLPPRQREAFLMRYWEDMDIAETAAAMGCSEGSVKTHCFRAAQTLSTALRAKGIEL